VRDGGGWEVRIGKERGRRRGDVEKGRRGGGENEGKEDRGEWK